MKESTAKDKLEVGGRRHAPLATPTDLSDAATRDVSAAMNAILADTFALYMKTKNFHWHMSGPHFRDYHLLLDEQADQVFAMTDPIAERVRKLGRGLPLSALHDVLRHVGAEGQREGLAIRGRQPIGLGDALGQPGADADFSGTTTTYVVVNAPR
jgi:hypothetical protein